jgi:ectoine hydroxylase-related dioxygenase (phytanoyl-CoA dioxygenase family)
MRMTDEHIRQYHEEGYCMVGELIPSDLIEAVRKRTMEIVENKPPWDNGYFQVVDPSRYKSARGESIPWGIQGPAREEEVFREVADHSNLIEAMSRLLGGPVKRYTDQIGVKHGYFTEEQGGCSYFHQDSFYWHIEPHLGCNCWIPMSPAEQDGIALAVMPRSHAGWNLLQHESYYDDPPMGTERNGFEPFKRHRIPFDQIDFSKEALIPMNPGDGLFFTNYTWHRSEPNRTGETRAFYAIAYELKR